MHTYVRTIHRNNSTCKGCRAVSGYYIWMDHIQTLKDMLSAHFLNEVDVQCIPLQTLRFALSQYFLKIAGKLM